MPSEGNSLITVTSPTNNKQVTSPLIIEGTAAKNEQIEVNVAATFTGGSQDLGTFKTTANDSGEWSTTPINLWVPEDAKNAKFQISATQTVVNKTSKSKIVTVLPPQEVKTVPRAKISEDMIAQLTHGTASTIARPKVAVKPTLNLDNLKINALPTITSPTDNTRVKSPLTISGAAAKNERIEVNVTATFTGGSQDMGTLVAKANNKGEWSTIINLWVPEDAKNAKFQISATQTVNNKTAKSKILTVLPPQKVETVPRAKISGDMVALLAHGAASIKVSPKIAVKPTIDPAIIDRERAALPTITSPNDKTVITTPLTVEGTAQKESTIDVTIESNHSKPDRNSLSIDAIADENGKWKTAPIDLWLFEDATDARFTISACEVDAKTRERRISTPITVIPSINQIFPRRPIKPWNVWWSGAGKKVNSPMVIKGSAGSDRTVQILIISHYTDSGGKRVDLPDTRAATVSDSKGSWETNPIVLPAPLTEKTLTHYVQVSQIGLGLKSANATYGLTSDPNKVVAPTITEPEDMGLVRRHTVIKGTGVPNRYIKIRVSENYHSSNDNTPWYVTQDRVKVDSEGNWHSKTLDFGAIERPAPNHVFLIVATQVFPQYGNKENDSSTGGSSKEAAIRAITARVYE